MLGSITPLGERGRGQTFAVTATAFLLGSVSGGATLGALLGWLGSWVNPSEADWRLWVLMLLLAVGLVFDLRFLGLRLPTVRRQVNEEWLGRYRGWVYGAGFGFQLGLGVVTIVSVSATYLLLAAAFLSGSPLMGLAIGGAFGLTRALTLLPAARVRTTEELARLSRLIDRLDLPSRRVALLAEASLFAIAVGVANA